MQLWALFWHVSQLNENSTAPGGIGCFDHGQSSETTVVM